MANTIVPPRTPQELERLGVEVFNSRVKHTLSAVDDGKFVAIAVDDGSFEIDADDHAAVSRLLSRHPKVDIWLIRIGQPAAYRIGLAS